ncbi:MAG: inositol monophosphatase [Bacteroidales bacterium]|nr:inositol monophosphatase [Bacteroidales bacterium]
MNLELLTKQVANLTRVLGSYLKSELKVLKNKDIEKKGINDFVTYVDKTSEERLVFDLEKILPEAGFIAEENGNYKKKEKYNWIIDPLDGTTNFIHGVPMFSISIALLEEKKLVSGVVYEVNLQECFYAWDNGGAFLNGHKINVSETSMLKDGLMATGFPYSDFSRLDAYTDVFLHLMKNTHGVRRLGSAAVDLAYLACGRYDAFYEYGLKPWDVAAGSLIVAEAGGVISDFSGGNNYVFGEEIIAANSMVFEEFLRIIKNNF